MFIWIAVHTQRDKVTMQVVSRLMVPLPGGSGTNGGSESVSFVDVEDTGT
jgi:hypothetical protein